MDDFELVEKLIKSLADNLNIPVTAKIRIFPDFEKTLKYAIMIQNAGAKILTVHGRLREQKGQFTGMADWSQIEKLKQNLKIPIFSNGNILYDSCIKSCLETTKCDGVMVAESNLTNPTLFTDKYYSSIKICQEVLNVLKKVFGYLYEY
jgi:tRNA-dihydrouridine synthase 1